jgi:hypothetical protein
VRGDTAQYNYVRNECINGRFADDLQTFIDSKITQNPNYKDSITELTKFYVDTMYNDWFKVKATSIIYGSLDEAYKIKDDMNDYDYRYFPICRPTFLKIDTNYYIFNFNSLTLTKFTLDMKFVSTINLDPGFFDYFYRRDHNIISSYRNAYAISSSDDLGVVRLVDLDKGTLIGTQTLLRTITSEHRVEIRNGYIYYLSYYAYLEKNLYKEPLNMEEIDE